MYKIYTNKIFIALTGSINLWRIMRLVIFFIIISLVHASASIRAQTVTLNGTNMPLKKVLLVISQQTGYNVLYGTKIITSKPPIDVNLNNVPLKTALASILNSQQLDFTIEGKAIIIKTVKKSIIDRFIEQLQTIRVRGQLQDESGTPIEGATIRDLTNGKLTISDAGGKFFFESIGENDALYFSSIGYQPRQLSAKTDLGLITMVKSSTKLDEVQVQPYGQVSNRLSTANISTIKAADIANQPVNNPILALQGRVPGIVINQSSGYAGSNVGVAIQGRNSIAAGNDPFYVIDGVPYPSENLTSLIGIQGGGSPLSFLNPETIESIEVLKDADATSIYGARAANGAILITTKKGQAGDTKVVFNVQQGISQISQESKLLNTAQYLQLYRDAFTNDGIITSSPEYATAYELNGTFDQSRNIDWQKEITGKAAHYQDEQLTISGGNKATTFLVGANYHKDGSVSPGNLNDAKKSVQFSLTNHSLNNKLSFQLSGNYLDDDNHLPSIDLYEIALQTAPDAPNLYNSNGSLNWGILPNGQASFNNPLGYTLQKYALKSDNLLANSVISYEIIPGLNIKSSFGFNRLESNESIQYSLSSYNPNYYIYDTRKTQSSNRTVQNWIIEPQLTYKRKIGKGIFDALIGATFQNTKNNLLALSATGFSNDDQLNNIQAASTISVINTNISEYKYNALFARANYVYDDKYIGSASVRRDGSSRFGDANKFNTFYSVSGAYVFSEENLFKNYVPQLSFGKLKVSYGTSGSDQIADYSYLSLYKTYGAGTLPYQGASTLYPSGLTNPYLQWELTKKFNAGLDLGFIQNRILLSANYYRNTSSNELVSSPLPYITGFNSIQANLPATVRNTGWEFTLDAQPIDEGGFKWSTSINFTIPKNQLVSFPDLAANPLYRNSLVIGQPVGVLKLFNYQGVNPQTGLYQYLDHTGQLTSDPDYLTDNYKYVSPFPKYYGGFHNSFSYDKIQIDFLFQYVNQKVLDNLFGINPGGPQNSPAFLANHWTTPGQIAQAQKPSTEDDDVENALDDIESSTAGYRNGSYLRLKNASISWTFPKTITHSLHLENLRFYVLGQNLFTITKLNRDPETSGYYQLPTLRTITAGIQVGL